MQPWQNRIIGLEYHKPGDIVEHPYQWRAHTKAQIAAIKGILAEVGIAGALLAYYSPDNDGALKAYTRRHSTWADWLRRIWNDVGSQRGPLNYFQGALLPVKRDKGGDVFYRYEGLKRQYPTDTLFWNVVADS